MPKVGNVSLECVIVCDDVRKEITNKDIIIGVYAGEIGVSVFPAMLSVAFWIEISGDVIGEQDVSLRIMLGRTQLTELNLHLNIERIGYLSVAIPPINFPVAKEELLSLELKQGDKWRTLKTKKIIAALG